MAKGTPTAMGVQLRSDRLIPTDGGVAMKPGRYYRTARLLAAFLVIAFRSAGSSPPKEKTVTLGIQGMV